MGSVSINLTHLPYTGTVLDQPGKLLEMFDIVKGEEYDCHRWSMERAAKK